MKQAYCMDNSERYQILRPYIGTNEQILWSGNPCTTRKYKTNAFTLGFMIIWIGFSAFWTALASRAGGLFWMFGLPFLGIGFFMLYQLVIAPGKKLPSVVYAVTDTRAIVLAPSKNGYDMFSYPFRLMHGVNLSDMKNDSGSIVFLSGYSTLSENGYRVTAKGNVNSAAVMTDRFLMIDGVNEVYRLIMEKIEEHK